MKNKHRFLIFCTVLIVLGLGGWFLYNCIHTIYMRQDITETAIDTKVFRPYILGTKMSFAKGGNSDDYIDMNKGWSVQEAEHRCMVGKKTVLSLYIPDSVGESLRLEVDGFGVYPPKTKQYQEMKVFANDVLLTTWHAAYDGPFTVNIPTNVIKDNTMVLRFESATPYSPPGDIRKIAMGVRSIKIERNVGTQTKRKIGKWVKENLMGGGMKQEYNTDVEKDDTWL